MKSEIRFTLFVAAMMLAVAGCGRNDSVSVAEARERTSKIYSDAMRDLQAGHLEDAIKGFENVLRSDPASFSAHFQLATLLQDAHKDYIGAITHYRSYILHRPESDKSTVASERIGICERLYTLKVIKEADGLDVRSADDFRKLEETVKAKESEIAELRKQLEASEKNVNMLTVKTRSLQKKLNLIGSEDENDPVRGIPSDKELLEDDDEEMDRMKRNVELAQIKAEVEEEEAVEADAGAPLKAAETNKVYNAWMAQKTEKPLQSSRPATYKVQAGDTLSSIARRFYGDALKFRDIQRANAAIITTDYRITEGQVIKLP